MALKLALEHRGISIISIVDFGQLIAMNYALLKASIFHSKSLFLLLLLLLKGCTCNKHFMKIPESKHSLSHSVTMAGINTRALTTDMELRGRYRSWVDQYWSVL